MPIFRSGKAKKQVTEHPLQDLISPHPVPRKGNVQNLHELSNDIQLRGFDVGKPIHVVRLPNGDEIVCGGNHRRKAMANLGENTIPTVLKDAADLDDAERILLDAVLEIAECTGSYTTEYRPPLTPDEQETSQQFVDYWKETNI